MSFKGKTLAEVQAEMNRMYQNDTAYVKKVSWDSDRDERINSSILELAMFPLPLHDQPCRDTGLVLDVGCGSGGIAHFWPDDVRKIVAFDLSDQAIRFARTKHPSVEYYQGSAETFQDPKGRKFDTIVAKETIEHWTDAESGLDNLRSMIDPDGVLVVTTPNSDSLHARVARLLHEPVPFCSVDHVYEFGFEELKKLLLDHGFEVTRSLGISLQPYWSIGQFGATIRILTDTHPELIKLLGDAGKLLPHLAFCQAHACKVLR